MPATTSGQEEAVRNATPTGATTAEISTRVAAVGRSVQMNAHALTVLSASLANLVHLVMPMDPVAGAVLVAAFDSERIGLFYPSTNESYWNNEKWRCI